MKKHKKKPTLKKPKYTGRYKDRIKYDPKHAIPAAVLAYASSTDMDICRHLKMSDVALRKWKRKYPFFDYAIKEGRRIRTLRNTGDSIQEWVIGRLTPKAREVWDSIMFWQEHRDEYVKIRQVMAGQTEHIRKMVWLHAFVKSRYTISGACRLVGVSRQKVDQWRADGEFGRMVKEIIDMQGDFIEEALMDLVAARDTGAVIFASRTKNRDRGYGDKIDINHTGKVSHEHEFKMDRLLQMVSTSAQAELVEAMEKIEGEEQKLLKSRQSTSGEVVEVEATKVKDSDSDED